MIVSISALLFLDAWISATMAASNAELLVFYSLYFFLLDLSSFFVVKVYLRVPSMWSTAEVVRQRFASVSSKGGGVHNIDEVGHDVGDEHLGMSEQFTSSSVELPVMATRKASGPMQAMRKASSLLSNKV